MLKKKVPFGADPSSSTWVEFANRDFCPWANRYVYWLKEPVGWFVIAMVASILVGAFLSPLGWSIALGLAAVLGIGLGFPWVAVRSVRCALAPHRCELHEMENSFLVLEVRNRLPIPLMGLRIQDYLSPALSQSIANQTCSVPSNDSNDIALSRVPAWSKVVFRLPICPEHRGRFPQIQPSVSCAFPFGIWTARKRVQQVQSLVVWPMLLPAQGTMELPGAKRSETGAGERVSTSGDFLGVREFRRGDSLRSIHWVQSARQDCLVVCERGGPQQATVEIQLSTAPSLGSQEERAENLAWRVRIAASLIDILVSHHIPFHFWIDSNRVLLPSGAAGREIAWEYLSEIPWNSQSLPSTLRDSRQRREPNRSVHRVVISAEHGDETQCDSQHVNIRIDSTATGLRASHYDQEACIDLDQDIAIQLNDFLMEMNRDSISCG